MQRDSTRESAVREAARQLQGRLDDFARRSGEYVHGRIEPQGDYYSGELDPSSRGKLVRTGFGGGDYRFDGFIGRGAKGWEGGYSVYQFYGPTVAGFGRERTFRDKDDAIRFVLDGYKDAWRKFAGVSASKRDPARRRARPASRRARPRSATRRDEPEEADRLYRSLSQAGKDYLDEYISAPQRRHVVEAWKRVPERDRRTVARLLEGMRPGYETVESEMYSEMGYE